MSSPPPTKSACAAQASAIGAATLIRTIDELANALTNVREGDDARMAVEIALLKAARPDLDPSTEGLLRRIERLEQGTDASAPRVLSPDEGGQAVASDRDPPHPPPPTAEAPPADASDHQAPEGDLGEEAPVSNADDSSAGGAGEGGVRTGESANAPLPRDRTRGQAPSESGDRTRGQELGLDELTKVWPAVVDQLHQTAPALAASFEGARPVAVDADERSVTVGFPADHTFNKRKAEGPDKREQLAAALETVLGEKLRPEYAVLEDGGDEAPEAPPPEAAEDDHAALHEKIKTEFDAEEVG